MGVIKITDCNGKEFNVDVNKMIYNINDDLSSENNSLFITNKETIDIKPIDVTITNSEGETFSLTDSENYLDEIVDIDVYIEASHSGVKINNAYYTATSMLRDFTTYTHPFKKPLLKHHNSYSGEPIGRIISSDCIDSALVQDSKAIDVIAKVTDRDAITKFLDGRYNTVSIGASANTIICNHCGKHILKDGKFNFCGHWRGETYDGKLCTWNCEDLEYSELSVVNSPADKYAQVYKIVVNNKPKKSKESSQTNNEANDGNNIIDDIINFNNNSEANLKNAKTIQDTNASTSNDEKNNNEINDNEKEHLLSKINNLSEMIGSFQNQLDDSANKNKELEDTVNILKIDNQLLSSKLEKITDMYINDLIIINNLGREQNLFSKENSFKELKENLTNFTNTYHKNTNNQDVKTSNNTILNNDSTTSKVKTNPYPGLFNNDNYANEEEEKAIIDTKITNNDSFDSLVSALVK